MDSIETLREVLGWCTVMSMGLMLYSSLMLIFAGRPIRRMHARMFGLSDDDLNRAYFQYLSQFKIAVLIFNLVPYLALCIVG